MPNAWCATPVEFRLTVQAPDTPTPWTPPKEPKAYVAYTAPRQPLELGVGFVNNTLQPAKTLVRLVGLGRPVVARSDDDIDPSTPGELRTFTFELPERLRPGRNPAAVEWISTDGGDLRRLAVADMVVVVDDISMVRVAISPRRITGLLSRSTKVELENRGNEPVTLALSSSHPDRALVVDFSPSVVRLGPRQLCHANAVVRRRVRWLGSPRDHAFDITAQGTSGAQTVPGSFRQRSVLPPVLFKLVALAAVLLVAVWGLSTLARRVVSSKPKPTWVRAADAPDTFVARAGHTATWISFVRPDRPTGLPGAKQRAGDWIAGRSPSEQAVIVWGGVDQAGRELSTGAMYSIADKVWTPLPDLPDDAARTGHRAVWTGDHYVVWGGFTPSQAQADSTTTPNELTPYYGAQFDPVTSQWTTLPPSGLEPRVGFSMLWTGQELIVFGGISPDGRVLGDGGILRAGQLRSDSTSTAPDIGDLSNGIWSLFRTGDLEVFDGAARAFHAAAWDGRYFVINGGFDPDGNLLSDTYAYDVLRNRWHLIRNRLVTARACHQAVASPSEIIFLGGFGADSNVETIDLARPARICTGIAPSSAKDPAAWSLALAPDPNDSSLPAFTWKQLADAPEHLGGDFVAAWTGEMFAVASSVPELDAVAPTVYMPGTGPDTRALPSSRQLGFRQEITAAWSGSRLFVWGGRGEEACSGSQQELGCPTASGASFDVGG